MFRVVYEKVVRTTVWRFRKRVHWSNPKTLKRFADYEEARDAARTLTKNAKGALMIVRVIKKGRAVWVGDCFGNEEEEGKR